MIHYFIYIILIKIIIVNTHVIIISIIVDIFLVAIQSFSWKVFQRSTIDSSLHVVTLYVGHLILLKHLVFVNTTVNADN